jgi:uncharacterized protein (DUF1697 family)
MAGRVQRERFIALLRGINVGGHNKVPMAELRALCDALWIHYAGGSARSKLSPALLNRLVGSPVTLRNWRTVLTLDELARRS